MPFDSLPTTSAVIDRLRRGRALVARPDGWCQDAAYTETRVCAIVALGLDFSPQFYEATRYLKIALAGRDVSEELEYFTSIPRWNDEPGRQQHEVVALYDRAIEIAQAEWSYQYAK